MRPDNAIAVPATPAASDRDRRLAGLRSALRERSAALCATVEFLSGEADLFDPSSGRTRPVEAGIRLAKGQRLTLRKGRALVRMDDGSDLWLADGAALDLSPWGEAVRAVRLAGGKMLAIVAREAGRAFETLAAGATIRVTGTAFEADATASDRLNVAVLHGGVEVKTERGTTALRRGFASSAAKGAAPEAPRRWKPSLNDGWTWSAELAASSNNARVRPAYNAVAKSTGLPPARSSESATSTMNNTAFRAVLVVAAIAILGGGAWIVANPDAPAPVTKTETITLPNGQQATWSRKVSGESKVNFSFRDASGNETKYDAADPASIEAIVAQLPAEKRDKLREILAKELGKLNGKPGEHTVGLSVMGDKVALSIASDDGAGDGMGPHDGPPGTEGIRGDVDAATKMLQELIASGMPPEEARKVVETAIADSVGKRVKAIHGGDAQVFVQASMDGSPDGTQNSSRMMVFVQKDDPNGEGEQATELEVTAAAGGD